MLCLNRPPELTVLESVHCPSCSTHYGLKPGRVHAGIRRARCFRCAAIFGIEDTVGRLIEPVPAVEAEVPLEMGIGPEDLLDFPPILEEPTAAGPLAEAASPDAVPPTPSLTLGDLEGIEEEILEKTLVVEEADLQPAASAEPAAEDAPDGGSGGFTSAKDAIAKLLGSTPAPEHPQERRTLGRPNTQMDVEATLDALESTLGGVQSKDLGTQPVMPPPELSRDEFEPVKPMASTMKLTHDEIVSAMKAASLPAPSSTPRPLEPAPTPAVSAPAPQTPALQAPVIQGGEASMLKLQVGQEVYSNVSMDQITSWIEQGRVQDFHMVARQFSENWIEAGKVPALRPIFERVRRAQAPAAQQAQAVILPPPNETAPMKKSLFGGLFNRG